MKKAGRRTRTDCTLHPGGEYAFGMKDYHVKPAGSEEFVATIRCMPQKLSYQKWGVRPYGSPNSRWTFRPTRDEVIDLALAMHVPRETLVETGDGEGTAV